MKSHARTVAVASDSQEVIDAVARLGIRTCLTDADHPSGTDRLEEAACQLGLGQEDIVVNLQGDEPLMPPAVIDQVADCLANSQVSMASLYENVDDGDGVDDPGIVKVVTNEKDEALYFSRAAIPFDRDGMSSAYKRHLGIYAYRVSLLQQFVKWGSSPVEEIEKLEQLRALWRGERIQMAPAAVKIPPGVDTLEDLERVRAVLAARPPV